MGGKPRKGVMHAFECTMRNNLTGWDQTHIVFCEDIDLCEGQWHEVHENEMGDDFSDVDMATNWRFVAAVQLDRCAGCGGLRRPGPEGTGAVGL